MTDKFQKHYVSLAFLFLLLTRILIYGASIGDSIAFLALVAFTVFSLYIQNKNRDMDLEVKTKLHDLETDLNLEIELLVAKLEEQQETFTTHLNNQNSNLENTFKNQIDTLQNELNALRQQVGLIKVDQGFQTKPNLQVRGGLNAEKKKYF